MNTFRGKVLAVAAARLLTASAAVAAPATEQSGDVQLAKKVRQELVTLPWSGVFDNLAFEIPCSPVTLYAQVVQPATRRDAERRVAKLKGVERVVNNIEVLPLSSFDDEIRARTHRALFGWNSPLFRYGRGVNPSIHIIA